MNNAAKKQIEYDSICKNHSARSDKELYRICPSKLSRRELEELYFVLVQNNSDLKKNLNGHQDRIKALSTKVQRMTNTQKIAQSKESRECCSATKALLNEQKESMAELRRTNERLAERIRLLNMRLCSAKQFLRSSPSQCPRCNKCTIAPPPSIKNSATSIFNAKGSGSMIKTEASCQYVDKDAACPTTRSAEIATQYEDDRPKSGKVCNENRCRTLMDELKQKIADLEEELCSTHDEYSNRITRLEREVSDVRTENVIVRSERVASDTELQQQSAKICQLTADLRAAEANCNVVTTQLMIERRKVAELETQVKAANMSNRVAKTIEDHLTAVNNATSTPTASGSSPVKSFADDATSDRDFKLTRSADDSGYMDARIHDDKGLGQLNDELMKRVAELESQLGHLKESTAAEMSKSKEIENTSYLDMDERDFVTQEEGSINRDSKYDSFLPPEKNVTVFNDGSESVLSLTRSLPMSTYPNNAEDYGTKDEPLETKNVHRTSPNTAIMTMDNGNLATHVKGAQCDKDCYSMLETDIPSTSKEIEEYETRLMTPEKEQHQPNGSIYETDSKLSNESKSLKANDQHNRLQIPGPMPVGFSNYKKEPRKQNSQAKNKDTTKTQTNDETPNVGSESKKKIKQIIKDANKISGSKREGSDKNIRFEENALNKEVSTSLLIAHPSKDSIAINHKRLSERTISGDESNKATQATEGPKVYSRDTEATEESLGKFYKQLGNAPYRSQPEEKCTAVGEKVPIISEILNEPIEFCESHSRVCTCPVRPQKDVSVFRTCSGTLRFTTKDATPRVKSCKCADGVQDCEPNVTRHDNGTNTDLEDQPRPYRRPSSISYHQTYTIPSQHVAKQTRSTSPDNTEHEISSMTDLPSERDAKSPRRVRSPGEDKATTTYTESCTSPDATDYGSLSEGELPHTTPKRVSIGEKTDIPDQTEKRVSAKMEETLQEISQELARCKQLLLSQRPAEPQRRESRDAATAAEDPPTIALHRAAADRSLGVMAPPQCVFTLHIGTVVLSDEAVLNSRDKTLVLTWKFYNQNITMTRMRAGRVVLFDFATEYDVTITDEFLDYMKHEEMPLKICELNKQDQPFASCSLPLRDALLHTNRRADISLALVAGPQLLMGGHASDPLDSGDEMGVLDLWCMLRADPKLLPQINSSIARSSSMFPKRNSPRANSMDAGPLNNQVMQQVAEDEMSSGGRMSQDLDLSLSRRKNSIPLRRPSSISQDNIGIKPLRNAFNDSVAPYDEFPQLGPSDSRTPVKEPRELASRPSAAKPGLQYDERGYIVGNADSGVLRRGGRGMELEPKASEMMINQVACKIKSANDMRKALQDNVNLDNTSLRVGRLRPDDNQSSTTRASVSSAKNIFGKMWQRHSIAMQKETPQQSQDYCMKEHISRHSSSRPDGYKKSVTISPKYNEPLTEEPQRDTRSSSSLGPQCLDITILWLALNEECEAMSNPRIQRLFVAYSFLGRNGAELETPNSLPKPKHYVDKCYFNFTKRFHLEESDLPLLGHMARCRAASKTVDPRDCIQFCVVSEPPEDPLGLDNCEDIGYAYLHLGDLLAYSGDNAGYTEVIAVRAARAGAPVCGVLAVRVDGLPVLRHCVVLPCGSK